MLLTTQGCARLCTGPIIMQIARGYQKKKVYCVRKERYVRSLGKKPYFGAFPESKKGVVNYTRMRKAAHWPNNNTNRFGLSEKKFIV